MAALSQLASRPCQPAGQLKKKVLLRRETNGKWGHEAARGVLRSARVIGGEVIGGEVPVDLKDARVKQLR